MSLSYFDTISSTVVATFESAVQAAMDLGKVPLSSGELVVANVRTYWAHMVSRSDAP
jgi:hypothetical protein